ncbi:MAG: hypothetical protein N3E47_00355 [Candidatus Bathyarchaeota archaeon]|nr:hypothetical protein [Candidatus Bathyarchaeota archaeon]
MEKIKSLSRIFYSIKSIKLRPSDGGSKVLACPRCGGRNIRLSSKFDAWLMPKRYVCGDCGYIGPIVLEVELEEGNK